MGDVTALNMCLLAYCVCIMKCIAHGLCGLCGMLWYCGACCCKQRAFLSVQVTCTRSAWTEVGITQ